MTSKRVSYTSYLCLQTILSFQRPLTPVNELSTWTAERFFIVCHQTSELWASQILLEMRIAQDLAAANNWAETHIMLSRVSSLIKLLCSHLRQFTYLPRDSFLRFRPMLTGASGAESSQFRELLMGPRHPQLQQIQADLNDALVRVGPDAPHELDACQHDECGSARALVTIAARIETWRRLHVDIAEQLIADLPGTGGTEGVAYLRNQVDRHYRT